jgi:hypothetical protein
VLGVVGLGRWLCTGGWGVQGRRRRVTVDVGVVGDVGEPGWVGHGVIVLCGGYQAEDSSVPAQCWRLVLPRELERVSKFGERIKAVIECCSQNLCTGQMRSTSSRCVKFDVLVGRRAVTNSKSSHR